MRCGCGGLGRARPERQGAVRGGCHRLRSYRDCCDRVVAVQLPGTSRSEAAGLCADASSGYQRGRWEMKLGAHSVSLFPLPFPFLPCKRTRQLRRASGEGSVKADLCGVPR